MTARTAHYTDADPREGLQRMTRKSEGMKDTLPDMTLAAGISAKPGGDVRPDESHDRR